MHVTVVAIIDLTQSSAEKNIAFKVLFQIVSKKGSLPQFDRELFRLKEIDPRTTHIKHNTISPKLSASTTQLMRQRRELEKRTQRLEENNDKQFLDLNIKGIQIDLIFQHNFYF